MVTAPHNEGTDVDVDEQRLVKPGGKQPGGYNLAKAGPDPWTPGDDPFYLMGMARDSSKALSGEHAYPDSAATATAIANSKLLLAAVKAMVVVLE